MRTYQTMNSIGDTTKYSRVDHPQVSFVQSYQPTGRTEKNPSSSLGFLSKVFRKKNTPFSLPSSYPEKIRRQVLLMGLEDQRLRRVARK